MAHLFPLIATWFILSIYYISLYSRSTTHLPKFVCLESSISCLSSSGRNLDTSLPPNQPYDLSRNVSQPSTPMEGFFPIRIPFFRGSTPPLIFRPKNLVPSSRWIIPHAPCPSSWFWLFPCETKSHQEAIHHTSQAIAKACARIFGMAFLFTLDGTENGRGTGHMMMDCHGYCSSMPLETTEKSLYYHYWLNCLNQIYLDDAYKIWNQEDFLKFSPYWIIAKFHASHHKMNLLTGFLRCDIITWSNLVNRLGQDGLSKHN